MKAFLAALGFFLVPPVAFGQGLFPDRLSQNMGAGEEGAGRAGEARGSHDEAGGVARARPAQGTEGLPEGMPEGMPWDEKPAEDEGKKAPAEDGAEPSPPQEEVP